MRVRIEDLNHDGRGRGRTGKRTVLVSQALPGEDVIATIDRRTRGTLQGRVARHLSAEDGRVPHECAHEFRCTGCPLLAAPHGTETSFKRRRVDDALSAAGTDARVGRVERPTTPFGYRTFAKQVFARRGKRTILGSFVAGTHTVVDNRDCPILVPPLQRLLADAADRAAGRPVHHPPSGSTGLRYAVARASLATEELQLVLVGSDTDARSVRELATELAPHWPGCGIHVEHNASPGNAIHSGSAEWVAGPQRFVEDLLGYRHEIPPGGFCQINPRAAEVLFRTACEMAGEGATAIDAFAGSGALTLPLSERFARVVAIERHPGSAATLRRGAEAHGRAIEVLCAPTERALPPLLGEPGPGAVVLDPPRSGLGAVAGLLAESAARRIVILSCDPTTLAKDLPPLLASGFRVRRVESVDQFPRTAHIESVALLERT